MTNVVQCSLMQNNESGTKVRKKKERKSHHLQVQTHTHTHKNKINELNKERKTKLKVCPFLKVIFCQA